MATQQDKIREMANKKLLNGEQKKVLYRLFEQKINDRISKVKGGFANAEKEAERKILANAQVNPDIKKIRERIKQAKIDQSKAEKDLNKAGFSLDYHGEELNLLYGEHPELKRLANLSRKTEDKMGELKLKLLADIHGLPMTYDEMVSYIDGELSKIENA